MTPDAASRRTGLLLGLGAYTLWGFLPAFFKQLETVSAGEIVAQRILWSLLFLAGLLAFRSSGAALLAAMRNPRARLILAATAALIAVNWLIYVWAVNNGHILASSLGYFLNPLVNVAMGVIFLRERLARAQTIAVALAGIGVAVLAFAAEGGLWISLSLAFTFATYGLLRKIAPVEALEGLSIETLMLAPFALGWVLWLGAAPDGTAFGDGLGVSLLLIAGGVLTAVPLLLFAASARLLPYAELGMLQYIAPTLQFAIGLAYGETLTTAHIVCFAFIWAGLAVYAADGLRGLRLRPQAAE